MDAGKTIRKALLAAKSIAGAVGVSSRPGFARGGSPAPISVEAWHGSDTPFDAFDQNLRGTVTKSSDARRAHWLTGSLRRASQAARDANAASDTNLPIVTKWRLDMRNPHIHDAPLSLMDPSDSARVIALAKRRGHDAVIFPKGEDEGHPDYAVIDPKIATRLHGRGLYGYAAGGGVQADAMPAEPQPPAAAMDKNGLYSGAAAAARALPQRAGTASQLIASLKGVKPDEIKHSGVAERWAPDAKITSEDLAQHFENNAPKINESVLDGDSTRFKDYSTPGGANYRESLLQYEPPGSNNLYQSNHWPGHPNVLAHVRLSDRYEPQRKPANPKFDTLIKIARKNGDVVSETKGWKTATPGLVAHPAVEKGKGVTLTHLRSGLAVQRGLDYQGAQDYAKHLATILPNWDVDADQITGAMKSGTPEDLARIEGRNRVQAEVEARKSALQAGGKHALLLDELQSDWGQQHREEAPRAGAITEAERNALVNRARSLRARAATLTERDPVTNRMVDENLWHSLIGEAEGLERQSRESSTRSNIPDAPYIDNTAKWTDLGLKAALREAAHGGHSHLVWTPGEKHAERYKLSKHISSLEWRPPEISQPNDYGRLIAWRKNAGRSASRYSQVLYQAMPHSDIAGHVGKEVAESLLQQPPDEHGVRRLEGEGLSIGGRGMIGYYNNILPKRLLALAREHDPDAQLSTYKSKDKHVNGFPGIEITPRMRASIMKRGFKAFAQGGAVDRGLAICRALGGKADKEHVNFARGGAVGRDAFMEGAHPDMLNVDGSPRTFYHGTPVWSKDGSALGDIHEFDRLAAVKALGREPGMDAVGSWFSDRPDKDGAGMYAGSDGAVYPVHINMKNPWRPKSFEHFLDEMHIAAGRDPKKQNPRGRGSPDALRAKLIEMGHDGIVFPKGSIDSKKQQVFTPFHPEQIKSAVGNSGAFNPAERDITKASGGSVNHEPTEGQKEAGNYKKEHRMFHGLDISIENKKGSVRSGKDAHGTKWRCTLPADYGYIRRTIGADGDHVDCYIGPHADSTHAFIINQRDAKTRKFDEVKVMLGYRSEAEAVRDYVKAFSDGKGSLRMGGVQSMSVDALKAWLKRGDTTKKADHDEIIDHALSIARVLRK